MSTKPANWVKAWGDEPRYQHDCNLCVFLGNWTMPADLQGSGLPNDRYDLYYCPANVGSPTVIARYANAGGCYYSGLPFGDPASKAPKIPALVEAYRRAVVLELITVTNNEREAARAVDEPFGEDPDPKPSANATPVIDGRPKSLIVCVKCRHFVYDVPQTTSAECPWSVDGKRCEGHRIVQREYSTLVGDDKPRFLMPPEFSRAARSGGQLLFLGNYDRIPDQCDLYFYLEGGNSRRPAFMAIHDGRVSHGVTDEHINMHTVLFEARRRAILCGVHPLKTPTADYAGLEVRVAAEMHDRVKSLEDELAAALKTGDEILARAATNTRQAYLMGVRDGLQEASTIGDWMDGAMKGTARRQIEVARRRLFSPEHFKELDFGNVTCLSCWKDHPAGTAACPSCGCDAVALNQAFPVNATISDEAYARMGKEMMARSIPAAQAAFNRASSMPEVELKGDSNLLASLTGDFLKQAEAAGVSMAAATKSVLDRLPPGSKVEVIGDEIKVSLPEGSSASKPAEEPKSERYYPTCEEPGCNLPPGTPHAHRLGLSKELAQLLNSYSQENRSNTPDFILAGYMLASLRAFETATQQREKWYGREHYPGSPDLTGEPPRTAPDAPEQMTAADAKAAEAAGIHYAYEVMQEDKPSLVPHEMGIVPVTKLNAEGASACMLYLSRRPIVPGTLVVTFGEFVMRDNGEGSLIKASQHSGEFLCGTVNYEYGTFQTTLVRPALAELKLGQCMLATYEYVPHAKK